MSLDVYLYVNVDAGAGPEQHTFFSSNITHNLNSMAVAAGVYQACWHPEEIADVTFAADLLPLLDEGVEKLRADPGKFKKYNAPNGWGTYDNFLPWLVEYRNACARWPKALVEVWR